MLKFNKVSLNKDDRQIYIYPFISDSRNGVYFAAIDHRIIRLFGIWSWSLRFEISCSKELNVSQFHPIQSLDILSKIVSKIKNAECKENVIYHPFISCVSDTLRISSPPLSRSNYYANDVHAFWKSVDSLANQIDKIEDETCFQDGEIQCILCLHECR
jgi:hypothetical protein